ncbi:undecaprenyl-diphosphate phosphatase [Pseudomonadota bacterium]
MTLFQAFLLGIIQGITEFLPVSSSGHLVITQHLFQLSSPPVAFDVLVHFATLLAILVFFYSELKSLNFKQIKFIAIGSIPAVLAGLIIEPFLEEIFSSLLITAIGLFVTATILLSSTIIAKKKSQLNNKSSFIIGFFQALAITPGISRSGSTVVAGLKLGLSKQKAFTFSFLLSIPAIVGALILQLPDLTQLPTNQSLPILVGFISAMTSGLISLKLLQYVINQTKLHFFAYYCLVLSLLLFVVVFR